MVWVEKFRRKHRATPSKVPRVLSLWFRHVYLSTWPKLPRTEVLRNVSSAAMMSSDPHPYPFSPVEKPGVSQASPRTLSNARNSEFQPRFQKHAESQSAHPKPLNGCVLAVKIVRHIYGIWSQHPLVGVNFSTHSCSL